MEEKEGPKLEESTEDEVVDLSDLESGEVESPKPKRQKFSRRAVVLAFFIGLILGGLISGGISYIGRNAHQEVVVESSPTPTPTPTPTQSPEPEEVGLSQYSLQVLNGSGMAGQAGEVAKILAIEGFNEADIGNAGSSDLEETKVQMKVGVSDGVYDVIERVLSDDYDVDRVKAVLDETLEFDVVVTVGAKK